MMYWYGPATATYPTLKLGCLSIWHIEREKEREREIWDGEGESQFNYEESQILSQLALDFYIFYSLNIFFYVQEK